MPTDSVTTARIDYLQRCGAAPIQPSPPYTIGDPSARRLLRVQGIGKASNRRRQHDKLEPWRPVTTELITGLYAYRIPLAYALRGSRSGVEVCLGTWPTRVADSAQNDMQMAVIGSVLQGLYPIVDLAPASAEWQSWLLAGLALGIPSPTGIDESDGAAPIDRVIRSMSGMDWALLILAQPAAEQGIARQRESILNEMRVVMSAAQHEAAPSPLTEQYVELLKGALAAMGDGMATGGWRTGIYLLGDHDSYPRLASAWRSVMSGAKSLPEPVRTFDFPNAGEVAQLWALPDTEGSTGPGHYRRPFEYQTLLSTTQLAACVHLPELETPGFNVRPAPSFSVSRAPSRPGVPVVDVGEVMIQRRATGLPYRLELDQLTRHAFIAGLTGAGKTNTLIYLLSQAAAVGVPFLVIEPAKTEYRELLNRSDFGRDVRVFTVGREQVAPLRMNPFEVAPGVDVSTHLDLLKAVFTASFALWIPLPQVLEHCLVDLYTERGWDFGSSEHPGGDVTGTSAVPRLADLVAAVERTVPTLGYKSESTQEITASLTTRLNALRRGARGLMLDVERSIPMEEILRHPTVIELEGLGDDADKAFMMGLILIRLYEHRRAAHAAALTAAARKGKPPPQPGRLRHIVVVEESHRLLGSERKQSDAWTADPKGAFVDAFSQMLSEVRAYGQSIVVADQVPVRLAPDVIKNTNLKIGHRLVAGDDRDAMAKAMSMNEEQSAQLAVLPPGRAAVFSEGDHTPVIVQVPQAKDQATDAAIDDAAVARAMSRWRDDPVVGQWFASSAVCHGACRDPRACRMATALTDLPDAKLLANRLWHTAVEHPDGIDVVWPDVRAFVAYRAAGAGSANFFVGGNDSVGLDTRVHSFALHAMAIVTARRAVQKGWAASDVAQLEELARSAVDERTKSTERWLGATSVRIDLLSLAARLQTRTHDPLPLCSAICTDGRCPYLHALVDIRTAPRHQAIADAGPPPDDQLIEIANSLAQDITSVASDVPGTAAFLTQSRWRATACAAQLLRCDTDHPHHHAKLVAEAISAAGWNIHYEEQEK
ncbi:MAG: ATP-binding protein [Mycobacterium sp.]|nr:MAG: ATP-binding protein [Mycobacterium sp.]